MAFWRTLSVNRKLLEEVRARTIRLEYRVFGEAAEHAKYSGLRTGQAAPDSKAKPPQQISHATK